MNNLSPGEILLLLGGLIMAAAGVVNTLGSAAEKLGKAWRAAKAPNEEQDRRIGVLEKWREDVDIKLDNDNKRLKSIEDGNRASQRALLALLDHGIDGNNIEQMQHAKEELQTHLINR